MILCSGNVIRARDLRFEPAMSTAAACRRRPREPATRCQQPPRQPLLQENLHAVEGHLIVDALQQAGSRQKAADLLGVSPRTLRYKIARLRSAGIPIPHCRETARAFGG